MAPAERELEGRTGRVVGEEEEDWEEEEEAEEREGQDWFVDAARKHKRALQQTYAELKAAAGPPTQ